MKTLLLSAAAAVAIVTVGPALAQTAAPAAQAPATQQRPLKSMKAISRADIVQKVQKHFARLDANGDGAVTQAEADTALQARREGRGGKRFERLDSNKDGSVSRSEFDTAKEGTARPHRGGIRLHAGFSGRMFGRADANKDGRVTLQEATAMATAHFDSADSNRDGTLSADEMRAAHQSMRAKSRS